MTGTETARSVQRRDHRQAAPRAVGLALGFCAVVALSACEGDQRTRGNLLTEDRIAEITEGQSLQSDVVAEYETQTRITPMLPDYNQMYRLQMRDWVDSLTAGREPPIPVQAAVDVLSVIDAVYESARSGSPVAVVIG